MNYQEIDEWIQAAMIQMADGSDNPVKATIGHSDKTIVIGVKIGATDLLVVNSIIEAMKKKGIEVFSCKFWAGTPKRLNIRILANYNL